MFRRFFSLRRVSKSGPLSASRGRCRPVLEAFEDRCLPATFSWFQAVDGNFNDPARWRNDQSQPGVPGPNDTAVINISGNFTVTLTASHTVNRIFAGNRVAVNPGTTLTLANSLDNSRFGQLLLQGALTTNGGVTQILDNSDLQGVMTTGVAAVLQFGSGTHQFNAGAAFSGAGRVILGGSFNVNIAHSTAAAVELVAGGTLGGVANFTLTNRLTWTGGAMSGTGQTVIPVGATLTLAGTDLKSLSQRTVLTQGTTIISGSGSLGAGNGAIWTNAAGATVDIQSDADFFYAFGSSPALTFTNAGTLRKSGGGTSGFGGGTIFNSTGAVQVQAGTLSLASGSASSIFDIASGAALTFADGGQTFTLAAEAALAGAGTTIVSAGAVQVTGNLTATNVTLSGGDLFGTGSVTVSGAFLWTRGRMYGTGSTTIEATGSLTLDGADQKILSARTLTTRGNTTIRPSGTGVLSTGDNAIWNIAAEATVDVQSDADIIWGFGATPALTVNNAGTFRKSGGTGASDFAINTVLNNTGVVEVQTGTLGLAGGTASQPIAVAADAVLQFTGTYTLAEGSGITGDGLARHVAGTTTVTGQVAVTNFRFDNGIVTGPGTLSVLATFLWTGGTMIGTGATTLEAGAVLTFDGAAQKLLVQRTLNTLGDTTFAPGSSGRLGTGDNATWNNAGVVDIQSEVDVIYVTGSTPALQLFNTGIVRKSAGATTVFSDHSLLHNAGSVEVVSGTLELAGGTSAGLFDVAAAGLLHFTSGVHVLNAGAAFTGEGLTRVLGGTFTVGAEVAAFNFGLDGGTLSGPGTFRVDNFFDWTGGTMFDTNGVTHLALTATMAINGNANKLMNGRTFLLEGIAQWSDSGNITLGNNATINNIGYLDISHLTDIGLTGAGIFNNSGKVLKAGAGRTTFGVTFSNNGGIVYVYEGSLAVTGAFNQNAGITEVHTTLAATGGVDIRSGDFYLFGQVTGNVLVSGVGATLHGAGTVTGNLTNGGIIYVGGQAAAGQLTVGGNFTQLGLGVLNLELGGLAAGIEYDQLRVLGSSTLNGTVNVELINEFLVSAGDTFRVLQTGSRTGTFAILNLPNITPASWDPRYDSNGLTLAAT